MFCEFGDWVTDNLGMRTIFYILGWCWCQRLTHCSGTGWPRARVRIFFTVGPGTDHLCVTFTRSSLPSLSVLFTREEIRGKLSSFMFIWWPKLRCKLTSQKVRKLFDGEKVKSSSSMLSDVDNVLALWLRMTKTQTSTRSEDQRRDNYILS